ncbi:alanine racemase [Tessaracoccus caeni]|uniref:alanine racemase n=1 Tax=Tessaracoccus caeni TaxID=3031239 RepID=UPI0023DA3F78|nr:alanine racemase [Tessaracoccus caeni]MDF1489009.1 alanine racemase [Tessaracoccus caeni]
MPNPTVLQVNLAAINHNLAEVRRLAGGRLVLAAVKANAYGHGIVEVSRSIEASGSADWLGVATVDEGLLLREGGITLPILKFSPTLSDEEVAVSAGITLGVGDEASIRRISAAGQATGKTADVHLKVDTGMHRFGAAIDEAPGLARLIESLPNIALTGLFTHLPVSDVPDGETFTHDQLARFRALADEIRGIASAEILVHAANSGGVLGHDLTGTDMVRPGIMVYGSYPDVLTPRTADLRPTERWTSRLTFIQRVSAGETVGYGRTWTAPHDTYVGTVAVGYGDGYSRLLSSLGRMLIDGASYPIVGRVCMDQTMIDLGPEPRCAVGDEVVLVGTSGDETITVAELADLMATIPYEVTCLITPRVPRTYIS